MEALTKEDIAATFAEATLHGVWQGFDERTSLLEYRGVGYPRPWLSLATVEDIFVLIAHLRGLRLDRGGLAEIAAATLSAKGFAAALSAVAAVRQRQPRSYRVIARKAGEHAFRRVDAQRAVEGSVHSRYPKLRLVADDADLEFWLTVIGREALLGLRLSTGAMRGRHYPFRSIPASLRPSVARAMVRLSQPRPTDTVLDPLCGAGTLLIERALAAPVAALYGGDNDAAALAKARANAKAAGVAADIRHWDALRLPLADSSVDAILTNPPFGKQVAIADGDTAAFYAGLVTELQRVMRPGSRLILITSQDAAFLQAVQRAGARLRTERRIPVLLRGERATIFVANKPAPARSPHT